MTTSKRSVRHPLRWIAPIAFVAFANGSLVVGALGAGAEDLGSGGAADVLLSAMQPCTLAAFVANLIVCAALHLRASAARRTFSRRAMLLVKLGLVPVFFAGGLAVAALLLLMLHPVLVVAGLFGIVFGVPLAIVGGWITMMGGSAWGIAYAEGLRNDGLISTPECVAHIVLQTILLADMVDAVVLFVRGRRIEARLLAQMPAPPSGQPPQPSAPLPPQQPR